MDVDSTLVKKLSIYWEKKQALVKSCWNHRACHAWKLDFRQALNERVATSRTARSIFDKVYARIHFNKGAKELVDELHAP